MSDYSELKRIAEMAPTGPWASENDSLFFKEDGCTYHLLDAGAGHDVSEKDYYAALNFIAAANPHAVLALIAEVERLKAGVNSDMEEIERIQSEYDKQFRKARDLRIERGKFKADNEALRKDAERYRWLRNKAGSSDWEYIGHQSGETTDYEIDAAMTKGDQP